MKLKNEFEPIRQWAESKGIYLKGDLKTQTLKLHEESGELCKAILNEDKDEIIDAIGDAAIVLTSIAKLASIQYNENITIEKCINEAYSIIAKRKGKMINGTFIKEN